VSDLLAVALGLGDALEEELALSKAERLGVGDSESDGVCEHRRKGKVTTAPWSEQQDDAARGEKSSAQRHRGTKPTNTQGDAPR
jgi:hypothetical protein